jgi:hypothetical protein
MIYPDDRVGRVMPMRLRATHNLRARTAPRLVTVLEETSRCRRIEASRERKANFVEPNRPIAIVGDPRARDARAIGLIKRRLEPHSRAGRRALRGSFRMRCRDRFGDTAGVTQSHFDTRDLHAASVANEALRGNPAEQIAKSARLRGISLAN